MHHCHMSFFCAEKEKFEEDGDPSKACSNESSSSESSLTNKTNSKEHQDIERNPREGSSDEDPSDHPQHGEPSGTDLQDGDSADDSHRNNEECIRTDENFSECSHTPSTEEDEWTKNKTQRPMATQKCRRMTHCVLHDADDCG